MRKTGKPKEEELRQNCSKDSTPQDTQALQGKQSTYQIINKQ